jgi:hypothetical protein
MSRLVRRDVGWQEIVAFIASMPVAVTLVSEHPGWPHGAPIFVVWLAACWVVAVFLAPLGVLVHELGHGLTAIALSPQRVLIEVGSIENPLTFSVGRVDFRLCLWKACGGLCHFVPHTLSRGRFILMVLAGPLASGAMSAALVAAALATLDDHPFAFLILGIAAVHAFMGFLNIVPSAGLVEILPGAPIETHATDGLLIWRAVGGHRGDRRALKDRLTEASHAVLFAAHGLAAGGEVGTRHVLRALAARGVVPGVAPDDVDLTASEAPGADARLVELVQRSTGAGPIEPADLLRGILDDPSCTASRHLANLGVDRRALRSALDAPQSAACR